MTTKDTSHVQEYHLYGSSRLGTYTPQADDQGKLILGLRNYELTNHLGNVLAVISDKKKEDLTADIVSSDYYPFGMPLKSRSFEKKKYRFGFQGQETEQELFDGNGSFFKYRISDNRIGRFFAIDPLFKKYPWNSSYAFSENKLIDHRELEGLEAVSLQNELWKRVPSWLMNSPSIINEQSRQLRSAMRHPVDADVNALSNLVLGFAPWSSRFNPNLTSTYIRTTGQELELGTLVGPQGGWFFQEGEAWDKHGFTIFNQTGRTASIQSGTSNALSGKDVQGNTIVDGHNTLAGFDVTFLDYAIARDGSNPTFYSSTTAPAPIAIGVFTLDFAHRGEKEFKKSYFEVGGGVGLGLGFSVFNVSIINSISIGHAEKKTFIKYYEKYNKDITSGKHTHNIFKTISTLHKGQGKRTLLFLIF